MKRLRPNKRTISQGKLREFVEQEVARAVTEMANTRQPLIDANGKEFFMNTAVSEKTSNSSARSTGTNFGRLIRTLASEGNRPAAYLLARKQFGEDHQVTKALGTDTTGGGGALVPEDLFGEVIELLGPRSVVRRAGAVIMDVPMGTRTVPRLASSATASYVAENADIPASEPGFDEDLIELKKLACLVPLSNELVNFTSTVGRADEIVQADVVQEIAQTEDKEFLIGDGASGGPEGLTTQALAAHTDTATSDEEVTLRTAVNHLEQANVPGDRLGWVMSPRTFNYLFTARDTNGNLKFPELRNDVPTLWNFPVYKTTAIPNDGGTNTNESQIVFTDFSQVVVAEALGMRVNVTQDGSYLDSGSTMRSAFTRDQTIIRAIRHHALYLRHPEAVAVVDAVTWGA